MRLLLRGEIKHPRCLRRGYRRHATNPQTLERMAEKLEHFIVASPYDFGLSVRASVKVPMSLMGENEGTFTTLMGEVKGRKFLPWAFDWTWGLGELSPVSLSGRLRGGQGSGRGDALPPEEGREFISTETTG
ncbi:MAG: hypothetical protein Q9N34_08345 [Aquificota bacterium]|nr:hypothetical protein [Aquificota bacterium]